MPSLTKPASPAQQLNGAIVAIAVAHIKASDTNPRKTFEGIEELAQSIKEQGLIENLVVRPAGPPGSFELIAGERRLRALKLAKIETAQCKVLNVGDGQAMAVQIVENLQRQDLGPLEQAEQFSQLQQQDPKAWTTEAIAKAVGKTQRFVQQRIAIAAGLSAPLKKKFAAGELTVEAARTLAPLPAAVQSEIPAWAVERGSAGEIRRLAFERCVPESAAKFDVGLYTGAWIEGDQGRRYFSDTAQFRRLQKPAAEKKLIEVQKDWPKAQLVTPDEADKWHYADTQYVYSHGGGAGSSQREGDQPTRYLVPKEKCTAIVWIATNGEIRKALGVCSAKAISAAGTTRQATSSRTMVNRNEPAAHKAARGAFNAAIAKAAKKKPDMIVRLMLYKLATDNACTKAALPASLRAVAGGWPNPPTQAKIWAAIAELRAAEVTATVAKLLLADLPSWREYQWQSRPLLQVAMAASLGVTPPAIALPPVQAKPTAKAKAAKKKAGK